MFLISMLTVSGEGQNKKKRIHSIYEVVSGSIPTQHWNDTRDVFFHPRRGKRQGPEKERVRSLVYYCDSQLRRNRNSETVGEQTFPVMFLYRFITTPSSRPPPPPRQISVVVNITTVLLESSGSCASTASLHLPARSFLPLPPVPLLLPAR